MALIFDLFRSDGTRVTFMTEDKVMEVLLVINLFDNIINTFRSRSAIACDILQWAYGQALAQKQFLTESCYGLSA